MDISRFIKGKVFLAIINEGEYQEKIAELLKTLTDRYKKICYICFVRPYVEIIEEIKNKGLDTNKFFFIDILTKPEDKPLGTKGCVFVGGTSTDSIKLKEAIEMATKVERCDEIVVDMDLKSIYKTGSYFVYNFKDQSIEQPVIVILKKGQEYEMINGEILMKDLGMLVDETVEL